MFARVFLVVICCLWALPLSAQGKRVALVIGNSAYKHTTVLKNPGNDATDMAAVFKDLGFEVIPGIDLEHRGLLRAIRQFGEAVKGADAAVLFYSGHGIQLRGTNYLVPVDAELQHEIEVDAQTVKLDLVLEQMERQAKTSIVFLDACRDNPLARTLARSMDATRAVDVGKGLAPVRAATFGTFVSFATAPNNVALDGSGRNSPFTEALKKYIVEPGKDLGSVMINVRNDVIAATKEKQVPWENSALRAQFFFKPQAEQPRAAPAVATSPQPPMSEAAQAWASLQSSKDVRDFEAFRRQYGASNPFYDRQAEKRIEELKPQVAMVAPPTKTTEPAPKSIAPSSTSKTRPTACDGVDVSVGSAGERQCIKPGSGKSTWFKDCPTCPEMVVAPAGRFTMGSPANEPGRSDNEDQVAVTIPAPLAVGRYAVTRGEFADFVQDRNYSTSGGCYAWKGNKLQLQSDKSWRNPGHVQDDRHPVACVNWNDAKAYAAWLSQKTGKTYRLLSESEREYVTRAGTTTAFWWGTSISWRHANSYGPEIYETKDEYRRRSVPVDSFEANPWGLYNVHGNVLEWTEDCYANKNAGNPGNGRARSGDAACSRVLRGGSLLDDPERVRAAIRDFFAPDGHIVNVGFRLARTLPPSP